jgi:hypothetical protein
VVPGVLEHASLVGLVVHQSIPYLHHASSSDYE